MRRPKGYRSTGWKKQKNVPVGEVWVKRTYRIRRVAMWDGRVTFYNGRRRR